MINPIQMPSKSELSSLRAMARATAKELAKQEPAKATTPPLEIIAERAYAKYLERGAQDGHDREDWLAAERELIAERSAARLRS